MAIWLRSRCPAIDRSPPAAWSLRFLGWAQEHFADEGLGCLGDEHGDDARDIIRLDLAGVVLFAAAEAGIDGSGSDDGDTDVVRTELFGDRIGEAVQSPL